MKKHGSTIRFYALMGVLNLAVATMFYTVNIKPAPILSEASLVAVAASYRPPAPKVISAIVGTPTRIVIPALAIDLPVGIGSYDPNGGWNVDLTKAYYADVSMPINNSNGNTLIYGHAQAPIFLRLPQLQPGNEAIIYTDSGYVFHYSYQSVTQVVPTDMSVFRYDGPPTLTLQTCSGDWDAYRSMFLFKLDSVEKA